MLNDQTIVLNLVPGEVPPMAYVTQDDVGRTIRLELIDGDAAFSLSPSYTYSLRGTKPSGTGFSYDDAITVSGSNILTFKTNSVMTAVEGRVRCGVVIYDGDEHVETLNFFLMVQKSALTPSTIIDSNDFESIVRDAVREYIEDSGLIVDDTLSVSGAAADAKKTGDEIADLKSAIEDVSGLSDEAKDALLACFAHVAWDDDDPTGQTYIDALEAALYPPAELVSISAVYIQSGTVYDTDTLDSLKSDLVVTAAYSDSSTEVVTTYTLSGTLTVGTSTITVTYGGKTTTFTVTVTHSPYVYNWDLTQSLFDTLHDKEFVLSGTGISQTSSGVVIDSNSTTSVGSNMWYGQASVSGVIGRGMHVEFDVALIEPHLMDKNGGAKGTIYGYGNGALLSVAGKILFWRGTSDKYYVYTSGWEETNLSGAITSLSGKTVVGAIDNDGILTFSVDGTTIWTSSASVVEADGTAGIAIGITNGAQVLRKSVFSAVRVMDDGDI